MPKFDYVREGSGPELLFVPGWCCDHWMYENQVEHFKSTHTVTAIDMRWAKADIPDIADEIASFCAEVEIERPVVIGHSLGGMIVVELGARHPNLARALVADDPGPLHKTELSQSIFDGFALELAGPTGEDVRRAWVSDVPGPTLDDERRNRIIEMMCAVPLADARAVIEGVARWNGVAALSMCVPPLLVIVSDPGGSNDPSRLQAVRPDVRFGMTVGTGHCQQLEVPEQVNAMIERFLQLLD